MNLPHLGNLFRRSDMIDLTLGLLLLYVSASLCSHLGSSLKVNRGQQLVYNLDVIVCCSQWSAEKEGKWGRVERLYSGVGVMSLLQKGFSGMFAHCLKEPGGIHLSLCTFRWGSQRKMGIFCLVTDCSSSQSIRKNIIIKENITVEFPFITWGIYSILIKNPWNQVQLEEKSSKVQDSVLNVD